jgi:hypothetical protein
VKWGGKGPHCDLEAKSALNGGLTWIQMSDKVCDGHFGTVRDMGELYGMLEVGEFWNLVGQRANLREGRDLGGLRLGSWTHFLVEHLEELVSLRRRVLEILVCLGLGI